MTDKVQLSSKLFNDNMTCLIAQPFNQVGNLVLTTQQEVNK